MKKTLFSTTMPPLDILGCENIDVVNPFASFPLEREKVFLDKVDKSFSLPSNCAVEYILIALKLEEFNPDLALWVNPADSRDILALYEVWNGVEGKDFDIITCLMRDEIPLERRQEELRGILKTTGIIENSIHTDSLEYAILKSCEFEKKISPVSSEQLVGFYERVISYDFESAANEIEKAGESRGYGSLRVALFGDVFYAKEIFSFFEERDINIVFIQKLFDLLQWDFDSRHILSWINHFIFKPFYKKLPCYKRELQERSVDAVILLHSSFSHSVTEQEIHLRKLPFKLLVLECEVPGKFTQREISRLENFIASL